MQSNIISNRISTKEIQEKGLYSISPRRRITKNLVAVILVLLTLLILLPLFDMLYEILYFGLPTMLKDFPFYFVTPTDASVLPQGGQNAIWSTLMLVLTTCAFSLPIGIPAGIYLASSNEGRFISLVRLVADVLQSAPSVILGFVIYVWWIIPRGTSGYGWVAGGLSLSFLMIPIVTRTTEEGIRTVPTSIYEAATSLGLPEWRITLSIAVKSAGTVILTGVMLGIARIAGETAPLIMTMLDSPTFGGFNKASPSLTYKIFLYQYVSVIWTDSAWAMSLILVGIVLAISLATRSGLLSKLWSYPTFKLLMIEFSVMVSIQTVLALTTSRTTTISLALFLLISLALKYLVYDALQKVDLMDKIWNDIIGRIVVLFVIVESFLELIIYIMGTYNLITYTPLDAIITQINNYYTNNAYLFLFRLSEILVVGLGTFYTIRYFQKGFTGYDKIRLLISFTFGLLFIRLTFFSLFLQFFYNVFVMLTLGYTLLFILFYTIKKAEIVNENVLNYLVWVIGIFFGAEILLYLGGYLTAYLYQTNYRLSEALIIVLGLYYIYYYFAVKSKGIVDFDEMMKYVLTIGFVAMCFFLTFLPNNFVLYVFLSTTLLQFFIWYIIFDNGYFTKIWTNVLGKLLVYFGCLEIIVQGLLLIVDKNVNYVYQINNSLFYVLTLAIALFVIGKYLFNQKTNFDRSQIILVGLFAINLLVFVYPSLIPANISLTYASATTIFGQFIFGLLLKTAVVTISLSQKEYGGIWNKISVRIIFLLGILETILEIIVIYFNISVKASIPIIMGINGILIYVIIFYYLLNYVFKVDLIEKIFLRNVINYGQNSHEY